MARNLTPRECVLAGALVATMFALIWLSVGVHAQPVAVDPTQGATIGSQAIQANAINWNTIILAFFSLLTTIATTVGGIYLVRIRSGQDLLTRVTNDTHTLVNSNMGVQLKLNAAIAARVAGLTGHPDDIAAASIAALAYDEHVQKQAIVDAKPGGRNA